MDLPQYVFCMWNDRLWPAKVLSRHKQLSNKCRLSVELFVVAEQLDVSLKDTRPFLMDELQKISDMLDRTRNIILTSEARIYEKALEVAAVKIKSSSPPASTSRDLPMSIRTTAQRISERALKVAAAKMKSSPSASTSTGVSNKQANEQREEIVDKKGSKPYNTRQNKTIEKVKGNCEGSKKKQKVSDLAISNDALEIPTTCATGVSPAKSSTTQRNRKKPLNKKLDKVPCEEKTVFDNEPPTDDQKSKKNITSVAKLKAPFNSFKNVGENGTKPRRPAQRRPRLSSKSNEGTNTDLPAESSGTDTDTGNGQRVNKYLKPHMPDFEEEKELSSSELSMEISSPECTAMQAESPSHDDTEEDIQLPVVVLHKEPTAIVRGSFVWCKYQRYPYWPSLVTSVDSKHKRVTVIFVEESISDPTKKTNSFKVALCSIKPYDCSEKQKLLEDARKDFGKYIDWCDSLISDYRIRLGCGSFSGSFVDYCTADISLPVRRELQGGRREVFFPVLDPEVTEDQQEEISIKSQTNRKVLPDRARAARDRANEKLVDFIVYGKEAENHLLDILAGKRESQWLKKFQSSNRKINCLETYIEDEEQIELVVNYLQTVCEKMSSAAKKLMLGDQAQFIFEVLIPEVIIFAISATEQMSYEKAEMKYLKGPSVSKRERKIFEEQILEKKRFKLSEAKIKKDSRK